MKLHIHKRTQKQLVMFFLTGVVNTLVDLGLLNLLVFVAKLPLILANLVAVSGALIVSYIDNSYFVFENNELRNWRLIGMYLGVTIVGLYGIETAVLYSLSHFWLFPGHFAFWIVKKIGLGHLLSQHFVQTNTAKLVAALIAAIWNFIIYKRFVFKKSLETTPNLTI